MLVDEAAIARPDAEYDVVIVGAGIAGITIAEALMVSRFRVLLIEAGGAEETALGRADCKGSVADRSCHPALDLYRVRALGGTSRIWGGRCVRFDPIDFTERDWIPDSGWPIPFEAIARYYPAALALAEAGKDEFDVAQVGAGESPELFDGLDGDVVRTTLERFSRPTNFWRRAGAALARSKNIHVVSGATVTGVAVRRDGDVVDGVNVAMRSGRRVRVRAAQYVLAGGGLETTRLLLASNDVRSSGLGNSGDALGRYYMSHLCATASVVEANPSRRPPAWDYDRDPDGIYLRRRLWLTEHAQRGARLLNMTFRTHYPDPADAAHGDPILSTMFLAKSLIRREYAAKFSQGAAGTIYYGRHLENILRNPGPLARFAARWTSRRILASRKLPSVALPGGAAGYPLEFHAEQSPNRSSRVTLGRELDRFGVPRLMVDWRLDDRDVECLQRAHALLATALKSSGAGLLVYDPAVVADRARSLGIVGGHQVGTTRMSHSERDGVVDRDCLVHGLANLHVAGSSVFPTSGQANPTLTVIALSLRLADRLAAILSSSGAVAA